jgi:hypothetical protein
LVYIDKNTPESFLKNIDETKIGNNCFDFQREAPYISSCCAKSEEIKGRYICLTCRNNSLKEESNLFLLNGFIDICEDCF